MAGLKDELENARMTRDSHKSYRQADKKRLKAFKHEAMSARALYESEDARHRGFAQSRNAVAHGKRTNSGMYNYENHERYRLLDRAVSGPSLKDRIEHKRHPERRPGDRERAQQDRILDRNGLRRYDPSNDKIEFKQGHVYRPLRSAPTGKFYAMEGGHTPLLPADKKVRKELSSVKDVSKKLPSSLRAIGTEHVLGMTVPKFKPTSNPYIRSRQIAAGLGHPKVVRQVEDRAAHEVGLYADAIDTARTHPNPKTRRTLTSLVNSGTGGPTGGMPGSVSDRKGLPLVAPKGYNKKKGWQHMRSAADNARKTQIATARSVRDESRSRLSKSEIDTIVDVEKKLSPEKLAQAKARARAAGRPYPNAYDNMIAGGSDWRKASHVKKEAEFELPSWYQVGIPASRASSDPINPLAMAASSRIMLDQSAALLGRNLSRKQKKRAEKNVYQIAGARGLLYSPLGMLG
jgi:hypothetical protein